MEVKPDSRNGSFRTNRAVVVLPGKIRAARRGELYWMKFAEKFVEHSR